MNDRYLNALYLLGTGIIHIGALTQMVKIFQTHSAEDIAVFWIAAIFMSHILRAPRTFSSEFWVWKLNVSIGFMLSLIILVQVIVYG